MSRPTDFQIRCHRGFGPPGPNPLANMDPLRRFGPPTKLSFQTSFVSYLVTNFVCKFFVDVLFNHNTTFLNKGKKKPSHFFPILPHLLQRVVRYTQELDVNKLLHSNDWNFYNKSLICFFWCESTLLRYVITIVETIASSHKNNSVWFSKIITLNSFWTRKKKLQLLLQIVRKAYDK